jgi:hypothetical protein
MLTFSTHAGHATTQFLRPRRAWRKGSAASVEVLLLMVAASCAHPTSPSGSGRQVETGSGTDVPHRGMVITNISYGPSDADHATYVVTHQPPDTQTTIVFRRSPKGWEVAPESGDAWNSLSQADRGDLVRDQQMAPAVRQHNENAKVFRAFLKSAVEACAPVAPPDGGVTLSYSWTVDAGGGAQDVTFVRATGVDLSGSALRGCLTDYVRRQRFERWASHPLQATFRFPGSTESPLRDAGVP